MGFRPFIQFFSLRIVYTIFRCFKKFQCQNRSRCIGARMFSLFFLLTPVDTSTQLIIHSTLDKSPYQLSFLKICSLLGHLINIREVNTQPYIVIIKPIWRRRGANIRWISVRLSFYIKILFQSGQNPFIQQFLIFFFITCLIHRIYRREHAGVRPKIRILVG